MNDAKNNVDPVIFIFTDHRVCGGRAARRRRTEAVGASGRGRVFEDGPEAEDCDYRPGDRVGIRK